MEIVGGRKSCAGKAGIYAIRNKISGKVYVGQAKDIYQRYKSHINLLRKNHHRENAHLRYSFNKYGEDAFDFTPLMFCDLDKEVLTYYENFWFTCFNNLRIVTYNSRPAADSNLGVKHSVEANKKKSKIGKDNWKNPEYRKKVSAGVMEYWTPEMRANRARWAKNKPNYFDYNKIAKNWIVVFPNGKEETITNLARFCREHNLNPSCMSNVASGRYKTHKGFVCRITEREFT